MFPFELSRFLRKVLKIRGIRLPTVIGSMPAKGPSGLSAPNLPGQSPNPAAPLAPISDFGLPILYRPRRTDGQRHRRGSL